MDGKRQTAVNSDISSVVTSQNPSICLLEMSHLLNNIYVPDRSGMFIVHSGSTLMIMIFLPLSNTNPSNSCIHFTTICATSADDRNCLISLASYFVGPFLALVMQEKYPITGHMQPLSLLTMLKTKDIFAQKTWAGHQGLALD